MFRVRLSSFFAGAAAASVPGFYFIYQDYKLAHKTLDQQVSSLYQSLDERYEALNARISALENQEGHAASSENQKSLEGSSVLETSE